MKLGVVIQGPLITYGQGPNNDKNGFSCLGTIIKNIEAIKKLNAVAILTTWVPNDEKEELIFNALIEYDITVQKLATPEVFDPDHRYKQHYGTLKGAGSLIAKNPEITHLVKIRTDMLMPVEFWQWTGYTSKLNENRLYVSELKSESFYQGDFIYFAIKAKFINYLKEIVSYKGKIIHPQIAIDMGMKNFKMIVPSDQIYLKLIGFPLSNVVFARIHARKWAEFAHINIGVMPEIIWNNILWREKRLGSLINSNYFKFATQSDVEVKPFLFILVDLLADYYRYLKKIVKMKLNKR